jgi:hypothetical protein
MSPRQGRAWPKRRDLAQQVLAMPAAAVRMSKATVNAVATAGHLAAGHMGLDQLMLAGASDESPSPRCC